MHKEQAPVMLLFSERPFSAKPLQITLLQTDGIEIPLYNVEFSKKKPHVRIMAAPNHMSTTAWSPQNLTTIGEISYHSWSSKIDISMFNQATFQMARTDSMSFAHHFSYGPPRSILGDGALWKEDGLVSDSLKMKTYAMKETDEVAAWYYKKMKICNRKDRAGFEIKVPVVDRLTLDAIVVTGIAIVKYRVDSDKEWGRASDELGEEIAGFLLGV